MLSETSHAFLRLLQGREQSLTLDLAAAEIARLEYPGLRDEEVTLPLDHLAEEIRGCQRGSFRLAAHAVLFGEQGFTGNDKDYYNPHNSCLNWVIASRRGIPITLSLIYLELARRLGAPAVGIAAPGHFLVRLEEDGDEFYLDAFRGGVIRDDIEEDLSGALRQAATRRTIAIRMLNNLRQIYVGRRNWPKAEKVLDWLLHASPLEADLWRQRSAIRAGLQRFRAASEDLRKCLELAPEHPEGEDLKQQLQGLRRMHATGN
ncbi:MAG: transglutaminase-like domain-containing protein [Bryobacter sp.]|nr:transglutaminase-like domain-containing protein [Bryobacter sp.]